MFWLLANQEFYINWKVCLVVVTVMIIDLVFVCLSTSIANIYLKKRAYSFPIYIWRKQMKILNLQARKNRVNCFV